MPDLAPLEMLLDEAAAALRSVRIPEARREARRLWADLTGRRDPGFGETLSRGQEARYREWVTRRAMGEPLPYVTGLAGFRRLTLAIDRRVLIPRPETEGLVELVLRSVTGGRVIDIGTGSGCIALALADEGAYHQVVGADRSAGALQVASGNVTRLKRNVTLVRTDLVQGFAACAFDVVVSNPPYLTQAEYGALDPSVREWEPREALVGDGDGLGPIKALLESAGRVLGHGGTLALEVDSSRAEACRALAVDAGWDDVTVHDDLFGRARYLTARRSDHA
jgi:release factor glutamine methyltransferase